MNILLVEGDSIDAEAIRYELVRHEQLTRVDVATSLEGARARLSGAAGLYDLVLADLTLPDGSALVLLEDVRGRTPAPGIVLLADTDEVETANIALKKGAEGFLVRQPDLLSRLSAVLHGYGPSESETPYRMLFKYNPHPMWVFDMETLAFLDVNAAAISKYGYTHDEFLAMSIAQIRPKEDLPRLSKNVAAAPEGLGRVGRWRHCLKDGQIIDVEIVFHMLNFKGRRAGLVLANDITQRQQTEDALRESEERYRRIYNETPIMLHSVDPDGRLERVNDYWLETLGYERKDVIGQPWVDFLTTASKRYATQEVFPSFIAEGFIRDVPYEVKCKGGGVRHVLLSASAERDSKGRMIRSRAALKDITDRNLAELRIEHLNRVLRAIRDVNQLIVREKDPKKLIEETCKLLVKHRGYDGALIILIDAAGAQQTYAGAGFRADLSLLIKSIGNGLWPPCCMAAREQGGIFFLTDRTKICSQCPLAIDHPQGGCLCIQLKQGETIYGFLAVSVVHLMVIDPEEEALFAELAGDVAFALSKIDLEKAIQETKKQRDSAEAALMQAQKMEAVGRLAGGVAHDFNNMLNVILGYAGLGMSRLDLQDPLYKNLKQIEKAAQRSADLTQQLLAFSRKQIVAPRVLNVNDVLLDQKKMLGRMIGEDIEFIFVPGAELWKIRIDRSQIDQILANLVVNARDAIEGVGTITIETQNVVLDEAYAQDHLYARPGEYVLLSVSDTGVGMDADTRVHIFEPFFTTKEKGKGTGLGLSTVFGIVKQNEGMVNVYSEPGMGTTFKVYLPSAHGEPDTAIATIPHPVLTGAETVLVVEDEKQVLGLVKDVLEQHNYTVLAAETPIEASRIAENYGGRIHLLVTDVIMPGMNGGELAMQIKTIVPGIKTLFMSGYTANVIVNRGVLKPGVAFLQKPFTPMVLAGKVREVLDA
jgi:two-component system, cell cycle sensor histidine kinase and response regulator CckA